MGTGLTIAVIVKRVKFNLGRGFGSHPSLESSIRAHGNFVEQGLFGAFALFMMEFLGAPSTPIIAFGVAIVILRIMSAIGITGGNLDLNNWLRKSSGGMTAIVSLLMSVYILYLSLA